jgi:hypothetical protein
MRLEREFAEDQQELIAPTVEVVGVDVENDVDEAPDIVDGDGLGVKVQEGSDLLEQQRRVKVCRASCRRGRPARRGLHGSGGLQGGGGERPFPVRAGDGVVAGFGGVGGLLFSLGEASEGRIGARLPFLGSSTVLLLGQAHGELLLLEVGGWCSSSRSRFQIDDLGVGGAGRRAGHGAARQEAGAHALLGREGGVAGA